jgi:predicted SnoaL-like aldol condensation-catalyzing enzyme
MSLNELRQLRLSQSSRDRAPRSRNKIIKVASLGNVVEVHRKTMDDSKENANHYSNDFYVLINIDKILNILVVA